MGHIGGSRSVYETVFFHFASHRSYLLYFTFPLYFIWLFLQKIWWLYREDLFWWIQCLSFSLHCQYAVILSFWESIIGNSDVFLYQLFSQTQAYLGSVNLQEILMLWFHWNSFYEIIKNRTGLDFKNMQRNGHFLRLRVQTFVFTLLRK